ncbi:MAG: helix-turn-helix domain-containing protein [Bradymonadaceae bacterium]
MAENNREVDLDQDVFTTFEVADICNANITSIKNWIDDNELKAHQTPGGHYRVKKRDLRKFLNKYRMPNPFRERKKKRILALYDDGSIVDALEGHFGDVHEYDRETGLTRALLILGDWKPEAFILEDGLDGAEAVTVVEAVQSLENLRPIDIIVVHDGDEDYADRLEEAGAQSVVRSSEGLDPILESIEYRIL